MLKKLSRFYKIETFKWLTETLSEVFRSVTMTLFMATMLAIGLWLIRFEFTQRITYIFLFWNLLLAWIPYICALFWKEFRKKESKSWIRNIPFIFCILFLPNAPYIITDLIHLKNIQGPYRLLDETLIFTCAWNGLMLFLATIHIIYHELKNSIPTLWNQLIILFIVVLSGFGIYVGRYLRFNSWDALRSPLKLINTSIEVLFNPFENKSAWAITLFFAALLWVSFHFIKAYTGKEKSD